MSKRLEWEEYFINIARVVASRATCPRASVGVVITRGNRILATGYNGAPSGEEHCIDVDCNVVDNHCITAIHGEINAIGTAARFGVALDGAAIYIYDSGNRAEPCPNCTKAIKSAGITSIIVRGDKING